MMVKVKYVYAFMSLLGVLLAATPLHAAETVDRNLVNIGCLKDKGICSVELNGEPVGGRGCSSNTLQFNALNDKNADAVLSLLTAAFFANKKVRFDISEQCSNQDNAPTFDGFKVLN